MVVIGGGIAGTVAAIALQRAGFAPAVHEAHPRSADERGAFLTLAVNGQRALRALGLDPAEVLAAGYPTPTVAMGNGAGRHWADLPLGGPTPDGLVTRTIRRADLYAALRDEAVRRGIPVTYGRRLTGLRHDGAGVTAEFADGAEARGALLVGADGLHSRTRTLLDPHAAPPRNLGLLNTGGFTDRPVAAGVSPGTVRMAFGRRCFFGWSAAPDGSVWWFANPPGHSYPGGDWRAHLTDLFAGDAVPARAIIAATDDLLGPWPTFDLPDVAVWRRGHAVLAGDAAHAMSPSSGQGASMAIEDAVVLGACVRDAAGVPEALAAYERIRRPRVRRVVAHGRRNGTGKAAGPVGRRVNDVLMPVVLRAVARRPQATAWLLDHRVA
ncbi:FAD-dependent oxidoreductase [Spirilliplanes yamanashiensis]|uniref:FAD-dependent oxidoreductase n=1 Tax=Spirilliplanes yamanashiensis TaxID=42233 RepID=A0A8J3Y416_9ACTN|nr:FAD-dependent oxidoreductase [Spirilliplanes yamanashiensis]